MAFRARPTLLVAAACLLFAAPALGAQISIPGTANIFGAGHSAAPAPAGGGGGSLPPKIRFDAASGRVMTVTATGTAYNGMGAPPSDPDGNTETKPVNVNSYGGISGVSGGRQMSLLAVFLSPGEPSGSAPGVFDFSNTTFTETSPSLRQSFFVGDGLVGSGSGAKQLFHIPARATRVFFGFADAYANGPGDPGYYGDNTGLFRATVNISAGEEPPPRDDDDPDREAVGEVVELSGRCGAPGGDLIRDGRARPLRIGMKVRIGDEIRTDRNSFAAVEFALGGRACVNLGSAIKIRTERSADTLGRPPLWVLQLKHGNIWGSANGPLKDPIEIQTNGGVMGIKG